MNILLVSYWMFPSTGAIDVYLKKLKPELEARGHTVDILSRGSTWHEMRLLDSGKVVDLLGLWSLMVPGIWGQFGGRYPVPSNWIMQREGEQYLFEAGAMKLCDLSKYDFIHAHDVQAGRAMARIKPANTPLVLTTHGLLAYELLTESKIPGGNSREWRYTYLREMLGITSSDLTFCPCEWMRSEYTDIFGVPPQKCVALPYGIDHRKVLSGIRTRPADITGLKGRTVITCVARLVPLKAHIILFEALALVARSHPDITCLLVGDGPIEKELRMAAEQMGLSTIVHFLGRRDDVASILGITDIFVLSSLQEITPLAITEAQLAARPVVATGVGGIPDLVEHRKTGILVEPEDPDGLASALIELIDNRPLRRQLGRQARREALKERTWDQHSERLTAFYDKVIREKDQKSVRRRTDRGPTG